MTRTPMPKPPIATPGLSDNNTLISLMQETKNDISTVLAHLKRLETAQAKTDARQATMEKRLADQVIDQLSQILSRSVTVLDEVSTEMAHFPGKITELRETATREINRTSLEARSAIKDTAHTGCLRITEVKDRAVKDGEQAAAAFIQQQERIREEADTHLKAMENTAVGAIAGTAAKIAKEAQTLREQAETDIASTAQAAADGFLHAISKAEAAFKKPLAAIASFEKGVADLRRVGPWLETTLNRHTRQITRGTGLSVILSACMALIVYRAAMVMMGLN